MTSRGGCRYSVVLASASLVTAACGRLGFDGGGDAGGRGDATDSAAPLDPTICDELAGLLVCEDFEGGPSLPTQQATAPSTLEFDGSRVYRGSTAMHSHTEQAGAISWLRGRVLDGATSGELHTRLYLNVAGDRPRSGFASIHLISDMDPYYGVVLGVTTTTIEIVATESGLKGVAPLAFPLDRWVCVQIRIALDPTNGTVETWIDEQPAARIDGIDTSPPNGYWNIHTGHLASGPGNDPIDMWTDEVVVSRTAIPCD